MSDADWEIINRIALTSFAAPLLLCFLLVIFIMLYQRKLHRQRLENQDLRLNEQTMLLEKHRALERERQRIATELHDDLGSGLTGIRYLSEAALKSTNGKHLDHLELINVKSKELVLNMSEIVWTMNSRFDQLDELFLHLRHYAKQYLADHDIEVAFEGFDHPALQQQLDGHLRRDIYLIVKEVLHNAVKHGKISTIKMKTSIHNKTLQLSIVEVGNPFEPEGAHHMQGNGMHNMKKRAEEIGGEINFTNRAGHYTTQLDVNIAGTLI